MTAARRQAEPLALPAVVGFQQYARFERLNYAQNCQRFSVLAWQPLLWGDIALVRSWGRLGSQGNQRFEGTYPDRQSAQLLAGRLIRCRLKRRYGLVDWT
ncbi:MAG: WGR domain-containing protein [Dehalococcoidia bacterium]